MRRRKVITIETKRITKVTYQVNVEDERDAIIKVMDFIRTNEAEGLEVEDTELVSEVIEFAFVPEDTDDKTLTDLLDEVINESEETTSNRTTSEELTEEEQEQEVTKDEEVNLSDENKLDYADEMLKHKKDN